MLALLLLADGRLPTGGHVHSGGVEAAVEDGRIRDEAGLEAFVRGRLAGSGLVDAALAAATTRRVAEARSPAERREVLGRLDAEAAARVPAHPLRVASRRLGRQLARVGARCWPHPALDDLTQVFPGGTLLPVALGVVGAAAGAGPADVAALAVHHAVTTPASAAVRLLGLDPFAAAAATAATARLGAAVIADALDAAAGPLEDLPARSEPLVELAAVAHAGRDGRLFAT